MVVTRFAPSPTGYLHLGHVYAANQAFGFAAAYGGHCLLRVENIDHTRCRPEYHAVIEDDLAWLGFKWPTPVRTQSDHLADYDIVIESLENRGLVYRCFKSRSELPKGVYRGCALPKDKEQEALSANIPFAWRLSIDQCKAVLPKTLTYTETGLEADVKVVTIDELNDEVLARKDIGTSYHVACCHDDALQGITHIVRGHDIAELTPLHRVLQELMGWPTPIYHHHNLLKNAQGRKLSKRNKDTSIRSLREQGFTAAQVLDMATP